VRIRFIPEIRDEPFKTQVRYLYDEHPVKPRYAVMQALTVEQGVVTSVSETRNDSSVCDSDTGR
jgi:hypothetical protein